MDAFLKFFIDAKMVGEKGILRKRGLVPMHANELKKVQTVVFAKTKLSEEMVKQNTILP
jgi:phosphate transport system substrate-binding protein